MRIPGWLLGGRWGAPAATCRCLNASASLPALVALLPAARPPSLPVRVRVRPPPQNTRLPESKSAGTQASRPPRRPQEATAGSCCGEGGGPA